MAEGPRTGPQLLPLDMGAQKIKHLGRSTDADGAARIDDIPVAATTAALSDVAGGDPGTGTDYTKKGHRHALNISPTTLPLANGVASVGTGGTYADILHTHPESDPAEAGSYLYPARVSDPLLREPCLCLMFYASGIGFAFNGSGSWEPVSGQAHTWRHQNVGPIYGKPNDGEDNDAIPLAVGDRVLAWCPVPYGDDAKCFGIYDVIVDGSGYTNAIIRRSFDANTPATLCHDMTVQLTHSLAKFTGEYFTLTTADPIVVDSTELAFSHASSYTPNVQDLLLTSYQLVTEGADGGEVFAGETIKDTDSAYIDVGNSGQWPTLAGTPGLAARPSGRWNAQGKFRAYLDTPGTPSGTVTYTYEAYLKHLDGSVEASPFVSIPFPPIQIDNAWHTLTAQGDDAGGAQLTTDRFVVKVKVTTTSTEYIVAEWMIWDAARVSWVQAPFVIGVTPGTLDHQLLENRDQDVGAGDDACHPWSALGGEGRPHPGVGTATIDGSGILTLANYKTSTITFASGATINGILDSAWLDADEHVLRIFGASAANPVLVKNDIAVGSGKLPFYLPHSAGTDANARETQLKIKASPAILRLHIYATVGVFLEGYPTP